LGNIIKLKRNKLTDFYSISDAFFKKLSLIFYLKKVLAKKANEKLNEFKIKMI